MISIFTTPAKRKLIVQLIAAVFIFLFIYTSTDKLFNYTNFKSVLAASPIISAKAALLAWVIPVIELLIAVLLLVPRTMNLGIYCSFGLMIVFTIYLAYMIYFTPYLPCSCGGVLSQMTWKQHLVFNTSFIMLSVAGIRIVSILKRKTI